MAIGPAIVTAAFPPGMRGRALGRWARSSRSASPRGRRSAGSSSRTSPGVDLLREPAGRDRGRRLGAARRCRAAAAPRAGRSSTPRCSGSRSSRWGLVAGLALLRGDVLADVPHPVLPRARPRAPPRDARARARRGAGGALGRVAALRLDRGPLRRAGALRCSGWLLARGGPRRAVLRAARTTVASVAARLALCGVGMGLFQAPNNALVMGALPRERLGSGGGLLATARNAGMAAGVGARGRAVRAARRRRRASGGAFLAGYALALRAGAVLAVLAAAASLARGAIAAARARAPVRRRRARAGRRLPLLQCRA